MAHWTKTLPFLDKCKLFVAATNGLVPVSLSEEETSCILDLLCDADSGTGNRGFSFGKTLCPSAVSRAGVLGLWERRNTWARRSALVMCLAGWSGKSSTSSQFCLATLPLLSDSAQYRAAQSWCLHLVSLLLLGRTEECVKWPELGVRMSLPLHPVENLLNKNNAVSF